MNMITRWRSRTGIPACPAVIHQMEGSGWKFRRIRFASTGGKTRNIGGNIDYCPVPRASGARSIWGIAADHECCRLLSEPAPPQGRGVAATTRGLWFRKRFATGNLVARECERRYGGE